MRSAALFAAAREDVTVSGGYPRPARAPQAYRLQFGGVWTAAETRAFERLLQDGAKRYEGIRAGRVATVALTSSQENHLWRKNKNQVHRSNYCPSLFTLVQLFKRQKS